MTTLLVILYSLSALLPAVGLVRLFIVARRDAGQLAEASTSDGGVTFDEFGVLLRLLRDAARSRPASVAVDFWLIGGGVTLGAVAGVLSVL